MAEAAVDMEVAAGTKRERVVAIGVPTLLAVALAVQGLTRWPLWDAELWTWSAARLDVAGLLDAVRSDRHPPLFFLLEWLALRVSDSDASLRAVPALAGVATVGLTSWVAAVRRGPGAAWVAGLVLATSPYLVTYAGTARAGTLTMLLAALALATGLELARGERIVAAAAGLVLSLGVGLYVHYCGLLALVAAALGGLLDAVLPPAAPRRRDKALLVLGAGLVAGLAFLPWALGPWEEQYEQLRKVTPSLEVYRYLLWPLGAAWSPPGGVLLAVLAGVGAVVAFARSRSRGVLLGWVLCALVVPLGFSSVLGVVTKSYLFAPLLPAFALLIGELGEARGRLRLAVPLAVGALVVGLQAPGLAQVLSLPASPASLSPRTVGVHDPRREVAVLRAAAAATGRTVRLNSRGAQEWLYYAPELAGLPSAWGAEDRGGEQPTIPQLERRLVRRSTGPQPPEPACRLEHAFTSVVMPRDEDDCIAILAAIDARDEGFGPFELELAVEARKRKHVEWAEEMARTAARHTPGSAMAELVLAGWLVDEDRLDEAAVVIDDGVAKAAAFGRREEWLALEQLRSGLGDHAGLRPGEIGARTACLQATLQPWRLAGCYEAGEGTP